MPQIAWVEWIGYIASAIVLVSFLTSSIIRLRLINLVGCGVFSAYGFLIHSYPTGIMNLIIAVINIYYLYKVLRRKEKYTIMPTQKSDQYLKHFLDFYKKDIKKFYPDFDFAVEEEQISFYVLRDMVTAGLFVGHLIDENTLQIRVDYAVPAYRDLKVGKYLYSKAGNFTKQRNITTLVTYVKDKAGIKYFKAMGFKEDSRYSGGLVKRLAETFTAA